MCFNKVWTCYLSEGSPEILQISEVLDMKVSVCEQINLYISVLVFAFLWFNQI